MHEAHIHSLLELSDYHQLVRELEIGDARNHVQFVHMPPDVLGKKETSDDWP